MFLLDPGNDFSRGNHRTPCLSSRIIVEPLAVPPQAHPFIKNAEEMDVDFAGWVCRVAGLEKPTADTAQA